MQISHKINELQNQMSMTITSQTNKAAPIHTIQIEKPAAIAVERQNTSMLKGATSCNRNQASPHQIVSPRQDYWQPPKPKQESPVRKKWSPPKQLEPEYTIKQWEPPKPDMSL